MTATDLSRYRILYATIVLLTLPSFAWVGDYPATLWNPPPGPIALMTGPPPIAVLVALELLIGMAAAALLLGKWIVAASITITLAQLAGLGFTYSIGKVDHDILFVIAPLFLAAAGWSGGHDSPWVMRLFAWTIGLAMLTAGMAKFASGGWTDLGTHATRRVMFAFVQIDRTGPLGDWLFTVTPGWAWKVQDYLTLILEIGLVFTVWSMVAFRRWLAVLCVFHFAIGLSLGILFAGNVVVYVSFRTLGTTVPLPTPRAPRVEHSPRGSHSLATSQGSSHPRTRCALGALGRRSARGRARPSD